MEITLREAIEEASAERIEELADILRFLAGARANNARQMAGRILEGIDRWTRNEKPKDPPCPTGEQWPWTCGGGVPAREGER